MGLGMAAVKAADGRLFAGMAGWLWLWCIAATAVCIVQPDVFIADFYDAPVIATSPKAWGDDDDDLALLFWRGAPKPVPPTDVRVTAVPDGERRRARYAAASHRGLMRGVAAQLLPDDSGTNPIFGVEIAHYPAAAAASVAIGPPACAAAWATAAEIVGVPSEVQRALQLSDVESPAQKCPGRGLNPRHLRDRSLNPAP